MDDIEKKAKVYIDKDSWPLFGQIPVNPLRDRKIKLQAKAMFGILHTYAYYKQLIGNPELTISLATLSKDSGLTESNVRRWLRVLRESGWIVDKKKRQDDEKSNYSYGRSEADQRKLEK